LIDHSLNLFPFNFVFDTMGYVFLVEIGVVGQHAFWRIEAATTLLMRNCYGLTLGCCHYQSVTR